MFLVSGCVSIKTDMKPCRETMGSLLGLVGGPIAENYCSNQCQTKGYTYQKWKCSSDNYVVCVCNLI